MGGSWEENQLRLYIFQIDPKLKRNLRLCFLVSPIKRRAEAEPLKCQVFKSDAVKQGQHSPLLDIYQERLHKKP